MSPINTKSRLQAMYDSGMKLAVFMLHTIYMVLHSSASVNTFTTAL